MSQTVPQQQPVDEELPATHPAVEEFDDAPVPPGARKAIWGVAITLLLILAAWMLTSCSSGGGSDLDVTFDATEQELIDTVTITPEELSAADGSGENAWVAVDGVVYDVSEYPTWGNSHHGVSPGTDATEAFAESPHGVEMLERMPVVGSLGG